MGPDAVHHHYGSEFYLAYYVYMTAGANKFLRIYYGKVRDHLAALDPVPHVTTSANSQ